MDRIELYRTDPAAWASEHFVVDRRWTGKKWVMKPGPIVLADYQADILRHIFEEPGRYAIACWSEPGKSGKSTVAALASAWVALHTDRPECYCIANDLQGARGRVFRIIRYCAEHNPRLHPRITQNEIRWRDGYTTAIPADYRGEAGSDPSLVVFDECEHYKYGSQERLIAEFKVSPTRPLSMQWFCGYGGWTGESAIWENLLARAEGGEPVLPHIRNGDGSPACWRAGPTFVFRSDVLRQPWQSARWVQTQRDNLHPSDFRRIILNQFVQATQEAFVSPEAWERCFSPHVKPLQPGDKTPVILALDLAAGTLGGDTCALVGVSRWGDGYAVRFCRKWDPPASGGEFDYRPIAETITRLARDNNPLLLCYDPYQATFLIQSYAQKWKIQLARFEQTKARELADRHLYDTIISRQFYHSGDPGLTAHVLAAGAKMAGDSGRLRIVKVSRLKKVDLAVAASMGTWWARRANLPGDPTFVEEARSMRLDTLVTEPAPQPAEVQPVALAAKLAAIGNRPNVIMVYTGPRGATWQLTLRPSRRTITLSSSRPDIVLSNAEARWLVAHPLGAEFEVLYE